MGICTVFVLVLNWHHADRLHPPCRKLPQEERPTVAPLPLPQVAYGIASQPSWASSNVRQD